MSDSVKEVILDIRGQVCPSTLLISIREINNRRLALRSGGERLVVLTDNRDSTHTLPDAARNMGYEVDVAAEGDHYRMTIRLPER